MNVIGEPIDHRGEMSKKFINIPMSISSSVVSCCSMPEWCKFSDNFIVNTSTETDHFLPIHREAPAFVEQATEQQILVTGIKVLSLPTSTLGPGFLCNFRVGVSVVW